MPESVTQRNEDPDAVLRLVRHVQAARRCAADPDLDARHHNAALKAALRGERWLYVAHGVHLP